MASSYGSFPSRGGQDRRERSSSRLVALTLAGLALAAVIGVVGVMRRREANVRSPHLPLPRQSGMSPLLSPVVGALIFSLEVGGCPSVSHYRDDVHHYV
jgi:hypothetical protein